MAFALTCMHFHKLPIANLFLYTKTVQQSCFYWESFRDFQFILHFSVLQLFICSLDIGVSVCLYNNLYLYITMTITMQPFFINYNWIHSFWVSVVTLCNAWKINVLIFFLGFLKTTYVTYHLKLHLLYVRI